MSDDPEDYPGRRWRVFPPPLRLEPMSADELEFALQVAKDMLNEEDAKGVMES